MALEIGENDFSSYELPLVALRHSTRSVLSQLLNPAKVIPSPTNLPRDWRGLADVAGVTCPSACCSDPTGAVISSWERQDGTINKLIEALKEIDRWDVIDDMTPSLEKDISDFECTQANKRQIQAINVQEEFKILTVDDVECIECSGEPQFYDAFLLYDDSDREFALTVLDKLENEFGLKLCTKDRDLIGGLPFEHEAIMQLIRDRCRRLIVVVSPLFLESPANKFFLTFAQALGIEQQQRKIIPCVYKKFIFPPQLSYYFVLDFTRSAPLWNFWTKLSQSIKAVSPPSRAFPPSTCFASPRLQNSASCQENLTEVLPVAKWGCSKKQLLALPSEPPCENNPSTSKSREAGPAKQNFGNQNKNSQSQISTSFSDASVNSESELIPKSKPLSTASRLSKVLTPKRIIPKNFLKKKKKVPVPVQA